MVPFLDLGRQFKQIEEEILSATRKVYEKGRFVLGEEVSAFEQEFAQYCGVRYGVAVGSGIDALHLALKAAGVREGDEVITVAHSFVASALAISFAGGVPVFVDVDPQTYTMNPEALEHFLRSRDRKGKRRRLKAILPVHLYGQPAEMNAIREIADRYQLTVIEDASQAHGAEYRGTKSGSLGTLGCFSFYPTKNLGAYGDGGMVVTDQKNLQDHLRLLRCYGEKRKYHHVLKGTNSRLDELQAAILRVKLKYLDQWNEERRRKAQSYTRLLSGTDVVTPIEREEMRHVYHLYVIRTRKRDKLQAFLQERGIGTLIHYPIPIHRQKAYQELGYQKGDLPQTEKSCQEVLSLPFFPEITDSEMEAVAETIQCFFAMSGRQAVGRQGKPS